VAEAGEAPGGNPQGLRKADPPGGSYPAYYADQGNLKVTLWLAEGWGGSQSLCTGLVWRVSTVVWLRGHFSEVTSVFLVPSQ
jgi:hypothetical protein